MDNQGGSVLISDKKGKLETFIKKRKKFIIFSLIIFIGVFTYYFITKKSDKTSTTYTLSAVSTSSIFSYVSGTGQVAAESQVDLKPKVSGTIVKMDIKVDQEVKEGDVLVVLDNPELERKVTEARNSLAIAQNNLDLKLAGASEEEILQAKNSLANTKISYENAVENLTTVQFENEENLKKAQQSLDSAQRAYDIASSSAIQNTESNNQEVVSVYSSAKSILDSGYTSLRSVIISADSILGTGYYSNEDVSSYKNLLGVKDASSLSEAINNFYSAKDKMETFEDNYTKAKIDSLSYSEIESLLVEIQEASESEKIMMTSIYNMEGTPKI
ncbi:MAG: efflux RND transporter periplasmic adaptor subunit [Candidatus ainarchaeum sp.]|nr:efflux RND transporter periplasmic adaptor subunit [Candidatus ainarchaeum sp.]